MTNASESLPERADWSTADDNLLRHLAKSGLSLNDITNKMRRKKSAVRSRVKTLGIAIARDRNPMVGHSKAKGSSSAFQPKSQLARPKVR
jgi:hypothetical protein